MEPKVAQTKIQVAQKVAGSRFEIQVADRHKK